MVLFRLCFVGTLVIGEKEPGTPVFGYLPYILPTTLVVLPYKGCPPPPLCALMAKAGIPVTLIGETILEGNGGVVRVAPCNACNAINRNTHRIIASFALLKAPPDGCVI